MRLRIGLPLPLLRLVPTLLVGIACCASRAAFGASEILRIVSPEGAVAQNSSARATSRHTDIIPRGAVVTVLRRDLKDPYEPDQWVAIVYSPSIPLCSRPDNPCFVAYDRDTFQRANEKDLVIFTEDAAKAIQRVTEATCLTCGKVGPQTVIEKPKASSDSLKSGPELDAWVRCHLAAGPAQEYEASFRSYLAQAAETFQFPVSLPACMITRETLFKKDVVNPISSAVGLTQVLDSTNGTLARIMALKNMKPQEVARLQRVIQDHEMGKAVALSDFRYAQTLLWQREHALRFDSYLSRSPTGVPAGDLRKDPYASIGMGTMYLRRIHDLIIAAMVSAKNPMALQPDALLQNPDYLAVLGGAYNMGENKMAELLRGVIHESPGAWRQQLAVYWSKEERTQEQLKNELPRRIAQALAVKRQADAHLSVAMAAAKAKPKSQAKAAAAEVQKARKISEVAAQQVTSLESQLDRAEDKYNKVFEEKNYVESVYRCAKKGDARPLAQGKDPSKDGPKCRLK